MMLRSRVSHDALEPYIILGVALTCYDLNHPCGETISEAQAQQLETLCVITISPHSMQVCYDHLVDTISTFGIGSEGLTRLTAKGWSVAQRLIQWWRPKGWKNSFSDHTWSLSLDQIFVFSEYSCIVGEETSMAEDHKPESSGLDSLGVFTIQN